MLTEVSKFSAAVDVARAFFKAYNAHDVETIKPSPTHFSQTVGLAAQ